MVDTWVLEREFETVSADIKEFELTGIALEIKPIVTRTDRVLFGVYIPSMPRMTSIISGKVLVTKLAEARTGIRAFDYQPWVEPFLRSMIESISSDNP
jgi:hypothetical protein